MRAIYASKRAVYLFPKLSKAAFLILIGVIYFKNILLVYSIIIKENGNILAGPANNNRRPDSSDRRWSVQRQNNQ